MRAATRLELQANFSIGSFADDQTAAEQLEFLFCRSTRVVLACNKVLQEAKL
jgi:hypothetical protein